MHRIFVAVDISEEARQCAASHISMLRSAFPNTRVRWERPEKLHLTLRFIGNADESEAENVKRIVDQSVFDMSRFNLRLQSTGVFPRAKKDRILWLGIAGETDTMLVLRNRIDAGLEKCGFTPDPKQHRAHLTVARIKDTGPMVSRLVDCHLNSKFEPVDFAVCEPIVYESTLHPAGSVYSPISRHCIK